MDEKLNIGLMFKKKRIENKDSVLSVAFKLNLTPNSIYKIESNYHLGPKCLKAVAKYLGISVYDLVEINEKNEKY